MLSDTCHCCLVKCVLIKPHYITLSVMDLPHSCVEGASSWTSIGSWHLLSLVNSARVGSSETAEVCNYRMHCSCWADQCLWEKQLVKLCVCFQEVRIGFATLQFSRSSVEAHHSSGRWALAAYCPGAWKALSYCLWGTVTSLPSPAFPQDDTNLTLRINLPHWKSQCYKVEAFL